jgi:hypothetical protein
MVKKNIMLRGKQKILLIGSPMMQKPPCLLSVKQKE